MDKVKIKNNFSKYCCQYDKYAFIQQKIARELLDMIDINENEISNILEIGCGTGYYTKLLYDKYKKSHIKAVDVSKEMILCAKNNNNNKNITFISEDAEKLKIDENIDLFTSNVAFQWFSDLFKLFSVFKNNFSSKTLICFSMYGSKTFKELEKIFELYFNKKNILSASRFISHEKLLNILNVFFKKVELIEKNYIVKFPCLLDFLKSIKYSGIKGEGIDNFFFRKNLIEYFEKQYIELFGSIIVSHNIFFCKAYG